MGVSVSPHFITKSRRPSKADLANLRNVIKIRPVSFDFYPQFFFSLSFFHSYISMDGGKEGRCLPKTCNRRCAIKKKRKKKDWGPETFRGRRSNIRATFFLLFYSRRVIYLSRPSTSTKICIDSERRPAFRRFYVSSFFFLFLVFFHARELQFKGRIIGSSKRKIRILVEKKRILEFLGDSLVARKK